MCSSLCKILLHMPIPTFQTSWHLKIRTPHRQNRHRHCLQHILPPDIYSSLIKPQYSWEAFWMLAASSDPLLLSFVINPNMKWRWISVFDSWTTVMGHPSKHPESCSQPQRLQLFPCTCTGSLLSGCVPEAFPCSLLVFMWLPPFQLYIKSRFLQVF